MQFEHVNFGPTCLTKGTAASLLVEAKGNSNPVKSILGFLRLNWTEPILKLHSIQLKNETKISVASHGSRLYYISADRNNLIIKKSSTCWIDGRNLPAALADFMKVNEANTNMAIIEKADIFILPYCSKAL